MFVHFFSVVFQKKKLYVNTSIRLLFTRDMPVPSKHLFVLCIMVLLLMCISRLLPLLRYLYPILFDVCCLEKLTREQQQVFVFAFFEAHKVTVSYVANDTYIFFNGLIRDQVASYK